MENEFYFDIVVGITREKPNENTITIVTKKTKDEFEEEYKKCRKQGNSINDSIIWSL